MKKTYQQLKTIWERNKGWIVKSILLPFLITRVMLFAVGWLAPHFIDIGYAGPPHILERGYLITPDRGLDMWARLDSGWYMDIAQNGYQVDGDILTQQSSVAFYPLFPYLLKGASSIFLSMEARTPENILIVGLGITNILFLFALMVFYQLIMALFKDHLIASRAVMLLILFPASFTFSCLYSESLFFLVSLSAFYFAVKKKWWLAGIAGLLSVLTRSVGVLLVVPLAILYMESIQWKIVKIRQDVLFLAVIMLGLPLFLLWQYPASHNLLASFQNQSAWDREFSWPWKAFFNPTAFSLYTFYADRFFVILAIFLSIYLARKTSTTAYSVYILLSVILPLFTGTLISVTRFLAVVFPIFIGMGMAARKPAVFLIFAAFFLVMQLFIFAAWSQFYWVV